MLESVRFRLTLWYTAVLALVLVVLSMAAYFILRQSTLQGTDSSLTELADAFLTTLQAELKDQSGPSALKLAAAQALFEHRYRDNLFVILDPHGNPVITSEDLPAPNPPVKDQAARIFTSGAFRKLVETSRHGDRFFQNVAAGQDKYRGFVRKFPVNGQEHILIVLQSLRRQAELLEEIARTFAWVIPMAVLLACAGAIFWRARASPRSWTWPRRQGASAPRTCMNGWPCAIKRTNSGTSRGPSTVFSTG